MFNKALLKKLYAIYKLLLFLITFIVYVHLQKAFSELYGIIFFSYSLDAALFFGINNKYFTTFSLALDIVFVYFIARLLSIEEMVIFSVIPLFFSCLFLECFLAILLLAISFLVLFFYSDLNIAFAIISYAAAFFSSYLAKQAIKQREFLKKKEEFNKEFNDKIFIAKRLSLEFAHEIRNPLMGISGAIEILKQTNDEKTKNEMINIAQQEIERANNLTRDFLNLEKPYELNIKKFEFCSFLREFSAGKRGLITIEIICKKDRIEMRADKEMIVRMLNNLVKNSVEAEAEHITINVSDTKDSAIMIFEDDGKGIQMEDNDENKIFLPFFTTKEQGSGLGLSICKQIAEAHGGFIEIFNSNAFKIELKKVGKNV